MQLKATFKQVFDEMSLSLDVVVVDNFLFLLPDATNLKLTPKLVSSS